ncbi:nitrate reductase [Meira miltonrushii]|uniref:Nitrate reductase [NADPH] n=1 Tax=Meira miltonrushii TaxID=1280837 RepID=A0A316VJ95_9BASI|nr:nitrate reductase [Meira miltonrushii]PWN37679.1 nitrate reductase [Meira miltonrushii]
MSSSLASSSRTSSTLSSPPQSSAPTTPSDHLSDDEGQYEEQKNLNKSIEKALANYSGESTDEYQSYLPHVPNATGGKSLQPLALDAGTPDAWIARDERMVRLTGKHPYNVEAPLTDLWKAGFLTPQSLFYVRSHGATPQVSQQEGKEWAVRIHGLVKREMSFTIDDLKEKFETVTLPVTLVCAGNRRKEQNMVTKGLGFNWGAAGVSNGLFTGVYLADVLDYCQPIKPIGAFPYDRHVPGRARHVIFEGADELPKGKYGTSQRLQWARDRSKGMLLAWGLNGEPLSPDHGFPLRLVVPGQIGGRMVKWLNRIEVSDQESQHYLHFWDNKLLPTQVTADAARKEEHWWYDPKYIINDLNVNAAITVPAHDQEIDFHQAEKENDGMIKVAGYAYTGGGKRVHRVEITTDEGKSWQLAKLEWPEDLYRIEPIKNHPFFGTLDLTETEMSFTWCFWEAQIPCDQIKNASSIAVRATDEGLAQMPRDMYWNAMSMMNNWWFRVAINAKSDQLRSFEHPTLAGNVSGGWMQRLNEEGRSSRYPIFEKDSQAEVEEARPVAKPQKVDQDAVMRDANKIATIVTAEQLKEHANETNPWFVVNGHVFDGTEFLAKHPGGADSITLVAGEDASEDFMAIHSIDAKQMMREFHVGKLAEGAQIKEEQSEEENKDAPFLHPKQWKKSMLHSKTQISHDSFVFRFALDREDQNVGLPIGQHVYVRVRSKVDEQTEEVETIQRAYTPFSGNELVGYLDILIKVYMPNSSFPKGGKMTTALHKLRVGEDHVELKGPLGHFTYEPGSMMRVHKHSRLIKNVAMIAGGSGITPIWSTLKGLIDDPKATETNIWIIDCNRAEEDILARRQLDQLVERASGRIKLWHILSAKDLPDSWSMGRGRISSDCLQKHLPPAPQPINDKDGNPIEDTIALFCGPPPMEEAVLRLMRELGWDTERSVVRF